MEVQKRKRLDDGEIDGKEVKTVNGDRKNTAADEDDDEVEEFYAILRRIHTAVKYFEKGNAADAGGVSGRQMTAATQWRPAFQPEDFQEVDGVKKVIKEGVVDNAGLDLNADPNMPFSDTD